MYCHLGGVRVCERAGGFSHAVQEPLVIQPRAKSPTTGGDAAFGDFGGRLAISEWRIINAA
jgi:hypothetical protein